MDGFALKRGERRCYNLLLGTRARRVNQRGDTLAYINDLATVFNVDTTRASSRLFDDVFKHYAIRQQNLDKFTIVTS